MGRLAPLRQFAAPPGKGGTLDGELDRNVVGQCHAPSTRHGLDMADYAYRDWESSPLVSLMGVDLHAVGPDGAGAAGGLFPDAAYMRAFLEEARRAILEWGEGGRKG